MIVRLYEDFKVLRIKFTDSYFRETKPTVNIKRYGVLSIFFTRLVFVHLLSRDTSAGLLMRLQCGRLRNRGSNSGWGRIEEYSRKRFRAVVCPTMYRCRLRCYVQLEGQLLPCTASF